MVCIKYEERKISAGSLEVIHAANEIIEEYQNQGFNLTLRQLYYQFVARGRIPNTEQSYKRIGSIINDARMAGLVDWEAIEDRTRSLRKNSHWDSPAELIHAAAKGYKIDKWEGQENRMEVWIEKDALLGVIEDVCVRNDVPYFSCRGYTSASEMWVAGQRLEGYCVSEQVPLILHLGDHDPSGTDMTRDIFSRLEVFMGGARVKRIALNMDQIQQFNPPPNPTKLTDSRARGYIREFGDQSWELDAMEPTYLSGLIQDQIDGYRNQDKWDEKMEEEESAKADLEDLAAEYADRNETDGVK